MTRRSVTFDKRVLAGILRDANIGCEDHKDERPHLASRHLEDAEHILAELVERSVADPSSSEHGSASR